MRIKLVGIVAPSSRLDPIVAERVRLQSGDMDNGPHLLVHPQCHLSDGHFAGDDEARERAFLDIANDPHFDAVWFARGGYGACRIAARAISQLNEFAREKVYLGYSDAGFLLAGLYANGFRVAHGPMPADLTRDNGEAAVQRALDWLNTADAVTLEPSLQAGMPVAAFNMAVLSHLLGTPLEPDLSGHVLMLEEVSEHLYALDRLMFHITSHPPIRRVAGIRLGRVSDIPPNDPAFGHSPEEIVRDWCKRSGIAYLGDADIGHDSANRVVPFGGI
jgi:muramoyltetrapeptide carboxypeptidase